MPLVSVCIPAYNSSAFIAEAIESVLAQSLADFEIIVTDNSSTDNTVEICRKYKEKDARILIHRNEKNIGAFPNFNKALSLASGRYVKFLMSDDLLAPTYLEQTTAIFEKYPNVRVVGCSQQNVDENKQLVRTVSAYPESCLVSGPDIAKDLLLKMSNDIGAPTNVLMKRVDYGGGFNCRLYFFADFELWLKALSSGDYYYLNEPLSILRLHKLSGTTDNFKTFLFVADILQLRDYFADFMEKQDVSKEEWWKVIEHNIMSYVDYILLEEKLSEEDVQNYILRMKSWVGEEYFDGLLKSMSRLIFYGFLRMHKLNIEARWNAGQINNLEREISLMRQTITWKIAEPFRALREKLSEQKD